MGICCSRADSRTDKHHREPLDISDIGVNSHSHSLYSSTSDISDFHENIRLSSKIRDNGKIVWTEFIDDIESIRHATRNICLLSTYGWHIDTIKKDWDMTIKIWLPSDFSGQSIIDSHDYLKLRFNQTAQILENQMGMKFPCYQENLDNRDFNLAIVIGIEKGIIDTSTAVMTLFFVASEQKGTECKLVAGQGLINLAAFKHSIGLDR